MKIELKNFKHAIFASEETLCFTAAVYVDGTRTFDVSNSGKGEENRVHPVKGRNWDDVRRVQDWIAKQPKVKLEDDMEINDDLDFFLSRLADREVAKKRLKALLRKHVVFYDPNPQTGGLCELPSSVKPAEFTDAHRKSLKGIYNNCLILNDLDFDQCLDFFVAYNNDVTSQMTKIYQLNIAA